MDPQKLSLSIVLFLSTLLISGDGWERTPQSIFIDSGQSLGGSAASTAVALGDIDGDGDLDAVMTISDGPSKVYVNQGGDQGGTEGDFLDSGQNLTDGVAVDVALDDLDGDGDLDAYIVLDKVGSSNEVWLNQGISTGVFAQTDQTFGEGRSPSSVALGDLDGIGGPDAFVSHFLGNPSKVWFNDGSGAFGDSGQMLDDDSADVALGDLDGDGDLDAFSANGSTNKVWVNQGGDQGGEPGIFVDSEQVLTSSISLAVSLGDVDGDGDLDAYVGNNQADRLWVNQGGAQGGTEGVFQDSGQSLSNSFVQTRDVSLGDLDGDGDLDAFLAKGGNEVWINQGGDQGGSEGIFQDSGQSLGDSASEGLALGDVDGDGDLDAIVANWGAPDKVWLNSEAGGGNEEAIFTDSGQELTSLRGNSSWDVALGDIDADGDVDAVVAQAAVSYPEENVIWLNDGQASFSEGDQFIGGSDSRSVALGDLDGDEDLDLFIANSTGIAPSDDEVWINQGGAQGGVTGVFSITQTLANGDSQAVELGDLDGDADLDALVGDEDDGQQQVWWNNGGGSFSSGPEIDLFNAYDVAFGDLDGDNDLDVVFAARSGGGPSQVFWNDWDTSQEFRGGLKFGDAVSNSVALADLDGDDDLDIYFANSGANQVWWNNGDETFTEGSPMGFRDDNDVALADLDGDGDVDAFVSRLGAGENANGVWLNNGDRTFTASRDALGNFTSFRAELADLDGDGDMDAFVANSGPNKVWLNERGGPDDGQTGLFSASDQDLSPIVYDVALGDLDGDGDLDAFLAGYYTEVWQNGTPGGPPGLFHLNQELDVGDSAVSVALGDLDDDGDLDAFLVKRSREKNLQVWLNGEGDNPPGEFSLGQSDFGSGSVALADLDGDGDLDAFVGGSDVEIWLNVNDEGGDPTGTFNLEYTLTESALRFALGDVDGDNDVDAFVVFGGYLLLNGEGGDPPGYFSQGQSLDVDGTAVALGDLDGDEDLDAFVARNGANRILINGLLGEEGTFTDSGQELGDATSTDVALGDLDEDGDLDAFITTGREEVGSQSNEIWENGGFNLANQCLGSEASQAVALGDLDNDGDLDALVASNEESVWFNGDGAFCFCIVEWLYEGDEPSAATRPHALGGSNPFAFISQVAELQTYLDVRDALLIQTRTGRGYARLYDQNNAEIYALLFADSTLRSEGLAALDLWAPHLQALLDGQGDSAIIAAEQVGAVDDFLANLSAAASPELQAVISAELAKLPPLGDFVGMSMEEARAIVLNDTIFLPLVQ